jgi:hypothetical protein
LCEKSTEKTLTNRFLASTFDLKRAGMKETTRRVQTFRGLFNQLSQLSGALILPLLSNYQLSLLSRDLCGYNFLFAFFASSEAVSGRQAAKTSRDPIAIMCLKLLS